MFSGSVGRNAKAESREAAKGLHSVRSVLAAWRLCVSLMLGRMPDLFCLVVSVGKNAKSESREAAKSLHSIRSVLAAWRLCVSLMLGRMPDLSCLCVYVSSDFEVGFRIPTSCSQLDGYRL